MDQANLLEVTCWVCVYQEAIEKKEKRARRFHFCAEESSSQRDVYMDKELMKKGEEATMLFTATYVCLDLSPSSSSYSSSAVAFSYPQVATRGHLCDGCGWHEHPGNISIF